MYRRFDRKLKLNDFNREYTQLHLKPLTEVTEQEIENVFSSLHKYTPTARSINCSACGYHNCRQMVEAIINQFDHHDNCIYYNRQELLLEKGALEEKTKEIETMLAEVNHLSELQRRRADELSLRVNDITLSIQEVHLGNDRAASEIEGISLQIMNITEMAGTLREYMVKMNETFQMFSQSSRNIVGIARRTNMLSLNAGIEAARASEAGREFRILAEEIRKLANESRISAEQTIADEGSVTELLEHIGEISTELNEKTNGMNQAIMSISAIIEEFTAKGEEIVATAMDIADESRKDLQRSAIAIDDQKRIDLTAPN